MVSKALTVTVFDYDSIEKEAKGKLIALAGQVKRGKANYVKNAIEIGCALHEAHELLAGNGRDGKFREWLECECGLEKSTAYNYLNSFNEFSKFDSVAQFSAGAMYELASPNTPAPARKEAMKRAAKGEKITKAIADKIIDSFTVDEPKEVSNVGHLSKPQASVTGTAAPIPGDPPDSLPSVGTVNRTEQGSQGDGGADGVCPKGGEHQFEDGACSKCLEPDETPIPEVVPIDPNDFNPANIEAHNASFAANFAAKVKAHNLDIERFARSIMEAFADPPASVWLDESRLGIALDQIKSACATIRQAKAHDKPCPKCDGKGSHTGKACKWCKGVGYMPERSYEMAGGQ